MTHFQTRARRILLGILALVLMCSTVGTPALCEGVAEAGQAEDQTPVGDELMLEDESFPLSGQNDSSQATGDEAMISELGGSLPTGDEADCAEEEVSAGASVTQEAPAESALDLAPEETATPEGVVPEESEDTQLVTTSADETGNDETTTSLAAAKMGAIAKQTYTGEAITPKPSVAIGKAKLREGIDYTLSYKSNKNVGTATITAKGMGAYKGSVSSTFAIVAAKIDKAKVVAIPSQPYTGSKVSPSPKVTFGGKTLKKNRDYTLSYKGNTKAGKATLVIKGMGNFTGSKTVSFRIVRPSVAYRTHVQSVGWQSWRKDGNTSGTTNRKLRLESIAIKLSSKPVSGGIQYRTHVQNVGWQSWRKDGKMSGTTGRSLRLEAIQIKLYGAMAKRYDVWYRAHAQGIGWMGWATNGQSAGTEGLSLRLEAIQIVLVPKRGSVSASEASSTSEPSLSAKAIRYASMVDGAWQTNRVSGATSGSTGKAKAVRAVRMSGPVQYSAKTIGGGWTSWTANETPAGSASTKVEAIKVRLVGDYAKYFDIWYRAHVSSFGWLSWTKNGSVAGSDGVGLQIEAYQVRVVPKGSSAPGSTATPRMKQISGDKELDKILYTIYQTTGSAGFNSLRRAYNYMSSGFGYRTQNEWPQGDWRVWSKEYAKELWRNGAGNCYRHASLMCWLAIGLGYDARVYCGQVLIGSGGLEAHGWVEVWSGGTPYVIDAELHRSISSRDFFWKTYSTTPVYYYSPQGVELT